MEIKVYNVQGLLKTTVPGATLLDGTYGDITISGGGTVFTVDTSLYQPLDSDLTDISALTPSNDDFLQRKAGAWANRTVAQVKTDLSLTGSNTGDQTITLGTDLSGSGTGAIAATIVNDAVTYAKMQNVSATDKVLGRSTAGAGDVEEIPCTAAGRALLAGANAAAQLTTLGVGAIGQLATIAAGFTVGIDGGGSAITTGLKLYVEMPFAMTVTGWTIVADQAGAIVIDIWKDTYANFPPDVADTIAGTEKPTLSGPAQKNQDLTLTTWSTLAIAQGDVLAFNVDSASTVEFVAVTIRGTRVA